MCWWLSHPTGLSEYRKNRWKGKWRKQLLGLALFYQEEWVKKWGKAKFIKLRKEIVGGTVGEMFGCMQCVFPKQQPLFSSCQSHTRNTHPSISQSGKILMGQLIIRSEGSLDIGKISYVSMYLCMLGAIHK